MAYKDIFALEREVKRAYEEDKSSDRMYSTIKELAEAILVVKSMAFDRREVDEIAHTLASEMWIQINYKNLSVRKWTKYIRLRLYKAREVYLKETQGVQITIEDPLDAERLGELLSSGVDDLQNYQRNRELEGLVENLPNKFIEIYNKYVRYEEGSYEYDNVKISLMLTVEDKLRYNRNRIVLFNLDQSYESYIRFLVILIYKRLFVYIKELVGNDLSHSTQMHDLLLASWNIDNID